jgi:hypothetical protein
MHLLHPNEMLLTFNRRKSSDAGLIFSSNDLISKITNQLRYKYQYLYRMAGNTWFVAECSEFLENYKMCHIREGSLIFGTT